MRNKNLLKTNLVISIVLLIGFALTAVFSYRANYRTSLDNIEQVTSLTAEGIYYQLSAIFTKPVNVSLTMARDSLLVRHLSDEKSSLEDKDYIAKTKTYLKMYREKYGFDSVFLVSTSTGRYYNFNGIDRVLVKGDPENTWYYNLLDSDADYDLEVDNDQVSGADNEITVFVNCKVRDENGKTLGVVGVGMRIGYLQQLLRSYEGKYNLKTDLIGRDGTIELSTTASGYEAKDWFKVSGRENVRREVLKWEEDAENLELWTGDDSKSGEKDYIVTRYIPELSWHLIVRQNTGKLIHEMKAQLFKACFVLITAILIVIFIVTAVIRKFNRQIIELEEERHGMFKRATEKLYDNIYELNLTKNCTVGERTKEYFESLGAVDLSYDAGLRVIAKKQIKEEYREGYISTFCSGNAIRHYKAGNDHLRYDFKIAKDGKRYQWMRIDAYIFYSAEDDSIHMFVYRKNIEEEKKKEVQAATDEMTGFFTKKTTERLIEKKLIEEPESMYAFFIFDIDNFKQANDRFGHAFGDDCIRKFTGIIRSRFRKDDILGRIGGDEFAAFVSTSDLNRTERKAAEVSGALNTVCTGGNASWNLSASIGVAIAPRDGTDFDTLYKNADAALYRTKQRGKNGYTIYRAGIHLGKDL